MKEDYSSPYKKGLKPYTRLGRTARVKENAKLRANSPVTTSWKRRKQSLCKRCRP